MRQLTTQMLIGALVLAPVTLTAGTPHGQDKPRPDVTFRSYTKLVQVPVVVTDRAGRPIQGLTKDDFAVYENGKKVSVAVFQAPGERPTEHLTTSPLSGGGAYTNVGAPDASGRPIVILVIDTINTPFLDQLEARRQLVKLLSASVPPDTVMSLMFVTKSGLRVVHEYTSDTQVLVRALKEIAIGSPGMAPISTASSTVSNIPADSLPQDSTRKILEDMIAGGKEFRDLKDAVYGSITLAGLRQIAQRFSGVPGKKSLLWIAANFPYFGDDKTSINSADIGGRYLNSLERLIDANIAVYPVDARGLLEFVQPQLYDPRNPGGTSQRANTGGQVIQGYGDTALGRINEIPTPLDNMKGVADITNGTAFYGSNDLAGMMRKAAAEASDYYMLGYYLPGGGTAKPGRREIKVTVPGKDVKVRSRTRLFVTKDSFTPREEIEVALKSPLPAANLPLLVKWDTKAGLDSVFTVALEPKELELSEQQRLDLTVVVEARTPEGKVLEYQDKTLSGNIAKVDEFRSRPFEYRNQLAKLTRPATVRFIVRDNNSGKLGSVIVELEKEK